MGIHVAGEINFKAPIHHVIFSNVFIAGVDNDTGIRIYARKAEKIIGIQKFNNPTPHRHHRATGSSENGRLLVIQLFKTKSTYLMLFDGKAGKYKIAKGLSWSSADELECSAFNASGKLVATGGNDGRVYVYTCKNGRLFQSLPPRADYIATMVFNDEGNLLAYTGYDKSLSIYDLHRSKMIYTGDGRMEGVIMALTFVPETHRIILADREGQVRLYDYRERRTIRTLASLPAWPMSLLIEPGGRYALAGDKSGNLHLFGIGDEEKVPATVIYKSEHAVLQMRWFEEKLYLARENGSLLILDPSEGEKAFAEEFEAKEYHTCHDMLQENSLLYFTETREKLDEVFEVTMKQLMGLIALGKLNDGKRLIAPFEKDERHKNRIAGTMKQAQMIYEFAQVIKEQQYEKAYRMAEGSEMLRDLGLYERLERRFEESFDKALKFLVLMNDPLGAKKAILPFNSVLQKRALIQNLFNHPKEFRKAIVHYQKKEYKLLDELALKNSYIKEAPFYKAYQSFVNNQEFFFDMHMESREYDEALEIAVTLERDFPKQAFAMREKIAALKATMAFKAAVESRSTLVALGLVDKNEFLTELPEYRKLDRILDARFEVAVEAAQKGDFATMHKTLFPLIKNSQLRPRALSTYRIFYIEEMAAAGSEVNETMWQEGIERYLKLFGRDEDLVQVAKNQGKIHLIHSREEQEEEEGDSLVFLPSIFKKTD